MEELRARVMALNVEDARRAAEAILQQRRFQPERAPRVLSGPLQWIGRQVERILSPLSWIVGKLKSRGVVFSVWIIVAVVGIAMIGAWVVRASRRAERKAHSARGRASERPLDLEILASEAFQREDYTSSVRLQFRAGIRRLALSNAVRIPEQRPNTELARALTNDSFTGLVHRFDVVTYGNERATRQDAEQASSAWPDVIKQSERALQQRMGAAAHRTSAHVRSSNPTKRRRRS